MLVYVFGVTIRSGHGHTTEHEHTRSVVVKAENKQSLSRLHARLTRNLHQEKTFTHFSALLPARDLDALTEIPDAKALKLSAIGLLAVDPTAPPKWQAYSEVSRFSLLGTVVVAFTFSTNRRLMSKARSKSLTSLGKIPLPAPKKHYFMIPVSDKLDVCIEKLSQSAKAKNLEMYQERLLIPATIWNASTLSPVVLGVTVSDLQCRRLDSHYIMPGNDHRFTFQLPIEEEEKEKETQTARGEKSNTF